MMKNITVKIDEETYHQARVRAAERGTSVSAMVREFLISETAKSNELPERAEALKELIQLSEGKGTYRGKGVKPLSRKEIYE